MAVAWDPSGPIMEGEDILIGYVQQGNLNLQDYYANTAVNHASDVSLGGRDDVLEASGTEDEKSTTIEFRRKLDTGDKFDKPLGNGTHLVQLAYASNDDFMTYHGEKRTVIKIDFLAGGTSETDLFAPSPSLPTANKLFNTWLLMVIVGMVSIGGWSAVYLLCFGRTKS
jgi:hypothetical protein